MGHRMRTDTELLTKKDLGHRNAKNLDYFDVLVFASTTGELDMDDSQKKDMMSFIKDDGKGFVGIHAALDTNYKWPEYGEMIGGWFDQHPWMTFNAPIINEDPDFPAVRHFPQGVREVRRDLSAQGLVARQGERAAEPRPRQARLREQSAHSPHRSRFRRGLEQDVRQGPRFLLHARPHGGGVEDPDIRKMYFEAIQWALWHDGWQHGEPSPPASAPQSLTEAEAVEQTLPISIDSEDVTVVMNRREFLSSTGVGARIAFARRQRAPALAHRRVAGPTTLCASSPARSRSVPGVNREDACL